jgi:predicted MFS family arabinose efflux permease
VPAQEDAREDRGDRDRQRRAARTMTGGRVFLPLAAGYFVSYVLRTVNAVVAPALTSELRLGPAELDRFGPRRVIASLLVIAAAGAFVFASGHGLVTLAVGRALVGLGVSACLMGALQVFARAFPADRQASLTGWIMAAGALGAIGSSAPLAAVLPVVGWRTTLAAVGVFCLLLAPVIGLVVPTSTFAPRAPEPWRTQLAALRTIARAAAFWRYGPQALAFTGGFMAFQSLWAVPWLIQVERLDPAGAARQLFVLNVGLLIGQLLVGFAAPIWQRWGLRRERLLTIGLSLALLAEAGILAGAGGVAALWFAVGLFTAASAQMYGVAAAAFDARLWGRVTTAVNLLAFVGAFVVQSGAGAAVQLLGTRDVPAPRAFFFVFATLWLAKVASVLWAARPGAAALDA